MKTRLQYLLATCLLAISGLCHAAVSEADKLAPEPTVNVVWVYVFIAAFILVCVGIGVGIYRADRQSKNQSKKG